MSQGVHKHPGDATCVTEIRWVGAKIRKLREQNLVDIYV